MTRSRALVAFAPFALLACSGKDESDDTGSEHEHEHEHGDADTDTDTDTDTDIEIAGSWADGWGGTQEISSETWTSGDAVFHISQFDNDADYAIAQNDAANEWNPDLWSRFDWTWHTDGVLYYCQTAYAAASETDALATAAADASDPTTTGCGGFSWTSMTAAR